MIGSIRGIVLEVMPPVVLVEVQGIGYRVTVSFATLGGLRKGEEAFLYTHDVVREDARELYGFPGMEDLQLFERMLAVSGVGPKVALAVLSSGSATAVKRAIMNGDLSLLTSVPGVGTKIAQKIILELKGQLVEPDVASSEDREVIEALVSLGYSMAQAKEALKGIAPEITDVSERVREALRRMSS
jgi:holliday junction DNA helicase RuvA